MGENGETRSKSKFYFSSRAAQYIVKLPLLQYLLSQDLYGKNMQYISMTWA